MEEDVETADEKSILRAWLYDLLGELELCEGVEATRTESPGRKVVIDIQFKI